MRLFTRNPAPIPCVEVVEIVTAYLEGAMPARDRRRFEAHLTACEHCTEYVAQIRETIAISGAIEVDFLSPSALRELRDVCATWAAEGA
jgi:anti-sigma factor RsiW